MRFRKTATYIVILFVLLFAVAHCAEAAEMSVGSATDDYTQFDGEAVFYADRLALTNWYGGFGWVNEREYDGRFVDRNGMAFIERRAGLSRCELGLGLAYLHRTDFVQGSNFNFTLSATCRVVGPVWLGARHFSNAGTADPNRGYDFLLLTWRF